MQISPIQPLLRSGRSPRLRLTMRILRASVCTGFPSLRPARLGCCNMNRSSCRWSALPRCCASVAPFRASTRKDSPEICCVFHSAGARSSSSASGLWRPQHHPVVYHPDFKLSPLPDSHRFPMPKVECGNACLSTCCIVLPESCQGAQNCGKSSSSMMALPTPGSSLVCPPSRARLGYRTKHFPTCVPR